ncbi:MAG: DUF3014 domain-containing protein [Haliea sp.]|nr:DUF3014 domain-containing protein [Haliea sp.]
MRADPDDVISRDTRRSRFPLVELVLALAVIAGLVIFWFWSEEKPAETAASLPPVVVPAVVPELPPTPDIPEREEAVTVTVPDATAAESDATAAGQIPQDAAAQQIPVDGDAVLRQQVAAAGAGNLLSKLASNEHPLDVTAALVDALGRGIILRKMLPTEPLTQAFSVERQGDLLFMGADSYRRYDSHANAIAALNVGVMVETFHTLRPLYKQAFEQLGLDPNDFDNAVIRALDMILATPEIAEPIALNTKSVVYIYADPALESLPALQKQLLRMGPDNIRRIKQTARALREGLLAQ